MSLGVRNDCPRCWDEPPYCHCTAKELAEWHANNPAHPGDHPESNWSEAQRKDYVRCTCHRVTLRSDMIDGRCWHCRREI